MQAINSIMDIFLSDAKFSKSYLSLHYPFTEQQIYDLGEYLHWGSAHYSVYLNDTDSIYSPAYGLCYNPNIQWTDTLYIPVMLTILYKRWAYVNINHSLSLGFFTAVIDSNNLIESSCFQPVWSGYNSFWLQSKYTIPLANV